MRELKDIVASIDADHGHADEPLFQRKYLLPIFLAVSIGMFNQLSGINAILYYLNDIFAKAGFSKVSGDLQAVAIGATNLLFTMIAMSVIDKLGRKTLLLVGAVGTAFCLAGVAYIFSTAQHEDWLVWLLVGYIAFFAFSQGAVIWVYLSEVFPNRVRAKGQSLGSTTHWVMNAIISGVFPVLAATLRRGAVRFFLGDDGGAVLRGAVFGLSGNQRRDAGRDAEEVGHRVIRHWRGTAAPRLLAYIDTASTAEWRATAITRTATPPLDPLCSPGAPAGSWRSRSPAPAPRWRGSSSLDRARSARIRSCSRIA